MLQIILVQGVCPLNTEITKFPGGFRPQNNSKTKERKNGRKITDMKKRKNNERRRDSKNIQKNSRMRTAFA